MIAFIAFWLGGMCCFALALANEWENGDRELPFALSLVPRIALVFALFAIVWPATFALLIRNARAKWIEWHRIEATRRVDAEFGDE